MNLLARLFALALIAVLPSIALEAWNQVERRRDRAAELRQEAVQHTRETMTEIQRILEGVRQALVTLAATPSVNALDGPGCQALLDRLRPEYPSYLQLGVAALDGRLICSTFSPGHFRSIGARSYFERVIATGRFTVGEYAQTRIEGLRILPAAYPIRDQGGTTIGVVLAAIELDWLAQNLLKRLPSEAAAALVDREGTILARHPDGAAFVGKKLPTPIAAYAARAGQGAFEATGLDGTVRIGAIESLSFGEGPEVTLGIGLSKPAAFRDIDEATRRGILLIALGISLALIGAGIVGRVFVQRPLTRLLDTAKRWREGDVTARAKLSGTSEFARLGRAFDEMALSVEARGAALSESEERLRIALEATGAGIWDFLPLSGRRFWSPRTFDLLGVPADTPPSDEAFLEAALPLDRARLEDAYLRAFVQGTTGRFNIEFRTRSGRWLVARGRVFLDVDGKPLRSVGTLLDISESKRIEAALFEKSPVALFLIGRQPDGRLIYEEVNPEFCRYTGLQRETLVGRAPEDVFEPNLVGLVKSHYETCFRTGRRHEYELAGELPAGYLVRRTILEPIEWDDTGQVRQILAAAMDLTQARRLEDALRQSQKIEALGQLTGGVAHDFNNLLTAVIGNLWLLGQKLPEGHERQLVESAMRAADRGARLTQQLLAFARRQQMVLQPLDLNELVSGMLDLLARTLGPRVEIETDLDLALWPALSDANQVELVVLNLAINGRDAMPEGGRLTIATKNVPAGAPSLPPGLSGEHVMLSVADTGVGMTEQVRSRAFEPFFTTKAVGKGSGLGLSMVYGVATQSGGDATIDSTVGHGTRICVFFPRVAATSRHAEHAAASVAE